jgi:signal transduction histidine kinase
VLVWQGKRSACIDGDPDLLHQVLVNLWLNALQAMEDTSGPHRLTVRQDVMNSAAVIEIDDTGPGLAPEARQRLFEPFYTTKPRGTGLGLVVARSIVEEHGGSLEALDSTTGVGARFRITLPLASTLVPVHV